jgi:predicted HTH transcriptional regulator
MDERQSLEQLISQGEGQSLEFKAAVPSPEHLARLIAAFANSGGGTILLGVQEDGSVPGVFHSVAR